MNKVILIGNLTRDPEITTTNGGINVCRFSVAVQRRFKNANGEYEADFINITCWRQLADHCHTYLKKGNKVGIVGQIQTRTYEQDGVKKYATDIVADEVEFLTPRGESNSSSSYGQQGYEQRAPQRVKASVKEMQPMEDDDLPF